MRSGLEKGPPTPLNPVAAPVKARLILLRPTHLEIEPPLHSGGYEVQGGGDVPSTPVAGGGRIFYAAGSAGVPGGGGGGERMIGSG